jgi:hypothetical protein
VMFCGLQFSISILRLRWASNSNQMFAFLARTKDKFIVSRTMLGQTGADVRNELCSND